jgi:hypothetical protein
MLIVDDCECLVFVDKATLYSALEWDCSRILRLLWCYVLLHGENIMTQQPLEFVTAEAQLTIHRRLAELLSDKTMLPCDKAVMLRLMALSIAAIFVSYLLESNTL